jgi:hypothetical protein
MNRNIIIDPDTFNSIQKMLDNNLNLNQIANALKKEKNLCYTYTTVRGIIQRNFYKDWDKENKRWIKSQNNPKPLKGYIEGQLELSDTKEIEKPLTVNKPKETLKSHVPIQSVQSEISIEKSDSQQNPETGLAILQKMYRLQKDVEDIKKLLLQLQRDNPKNRVIEVTDEFFKIYASDKNKSSVSINTELRDKVKKLMEEAYGIKDNDSLVINLALLMALYRGI